MMEVFVILRAVFFFFFFDAINQRTIEKSALKEIGGNWQKKELKNINL